MNIPDQAELRRIAEEAKDAKATNWLNKNLPSILQMMVEQANAGHLSLKLSTPWFMSPHIWKEIRIHLRRYLGREGGANFTVVGDEDSIEISW